MIPVTTAIMQGSGIFIFLILQFTPTFTNFIIIIITTTTTTEYCGQQRIAREDITGMHPGCCKF
jgi:hypothetical protein